MAPDLVSRPARRLRQITVSQTEQSTGITAAWKLRWMRGAVGLLLRAVKSASAVCRPQLLLTCGICLIGYTRRRDLGHPERFGRMWHKSIGEWGGGNVLQSTGRRIARL